MPSNFPLISVIADFTAGPPNTPGLSSVSLNGAAPSTKTIVRTIRTSRGRQYELNKVEAGTLSLDVVDGSEYLNPVNTGSPWNSGSNSLLPYRCVQAGMWWNAATKSVAGNQLNSSNTPPASTAAFDPSFESGIGWVGYLNTSPTYSWSTAQHFDGTHSLSAVFNASTDTIGWGMWTVPGQTYVLSLYVFVPSGHTVTASFVNFPGAVGTTIATATSSTTGAWQRLTMTGVPTGAVSAVTVTCTGALPATVYLDACQLEVGSTASAFTSSGPTYFPLYTGYVERYPQKWDNAGFRGLRPLEAVDALSPLSRAVISQSYASTILADGPAIYMPLSDDAGPQAVQRPKGGQPFLGYTQLGSQSGAVNFGGDSFLDGSKAASVVQQNTNPVTLTDNTMITYVGTRQGGFTMSPQSFTFEAWIKFSSGTPYLGAAVASNTVGQVTGPTYWVGWYTSGGALAAAYFDPNGSTGFTLNTSTIGGLWFPDGVWHYVAIAFEGSNNFQFIRDGLSSSVRTFNTTPSQTVNLSNLFVEATTYYGDPVTEVAVANMALYSTALSSTQRQAHYQRGIGYLGELPGNRASRLLNAYWSSNITTDVGKTALSPDFYYDPPSSPGQPSQAKSVLAALEDIADTEGGLVWVDGGGRVHFDSRDTRYLNQKTAQYVFGENAAGGELPYVELEYDYDPSFVYSDAQLTCDYSSNTLTAVNNTSRTAYGQRIISKTLYAQNDWDVQQAANFFVRRYAKPAGAAGTGTGPRIARMSIDPGGNPNMVAAALKLDVGSRVTVKRRTSASVTISGDYYIEQVSHNIDAENSTWVVDYQLSPVFVPTVWILGDSTYGVLGSTTACVY
ncbi:hypothetical protein [Amycolatopsis pigmentata]|uniref:Uncharacterized protein n=1 Tax=Amycolatopsis pigmentata TaxID=450801 RepID=A0ABW5G436_9PSEU